MTKTKKAIIISIGILIFVAICACGVRMLVDKQTEEQQANEQEEQASEQIHQQTEVTKAENSMTTRQQNLIKSYGDEQNRVLESLCTNNWVNTDDGSTLTFSKKTFTEAKNGEVKTRSFAISKVEDATDKTTTNIVLELGDDTTMLMQFSSSQSGGVVHSNDFTFSKNYKETKKVGEAVLSEIESEQFKNTVSNFDTFKQTLEGWVSEHFPTASEITWDKSFSFNAENNEATAKFKLNDTKKSSITATWQNNKNELICKKATS